MPTKYISVACAFGLFGAVLWGSTTGCSSSDTDTTPADSGASSTSSSSGGDGGGSSSSSTGGATSSGDSGLPAGFKDPSTVEGSPVTFGTCPTFAKADGDITGAWDVNGGCLPESTFDSYKSLCAGLTVGTVIIKASGKVTAEGTKESGNLVHAQSTFLQATLDINKKTCGALQFFGGENASCASINSILTSGAAGSKFDNANCSDGATAGTCECIAQATVADSEAASYTTDGSGTLTTTGATTRTFEYNVDGTTLTYHETTDKNPTFGMFLTLTKE